MVPFLILSVVIVVVAAFCGLQQLRARGLDRWLGNYLFSTAHRRLPAGDEEIHVLLCIADHYEPKFRNPPAEHARARVQRWVEEYPAKLGRFRDSDGRTPRHTFFFPAEEYEPEYLESLSELCSAGYGEIEVHLHHDNDTPDSLREKLQSFRDILAQQHGLLARHRRTGEVGYAFIHGNWSLCNSRPDGRYCGVNNEIEILRETGCYCDMTLPSAPSPTQTPTINSIYYAVDHPGEPCSHFYGVPAGSEPRPSNALLLIQGPLLLDWGRRKWGLLPRLENGCLQGSHPPRIRRLPLWLKARVQVPTRPDWFFVKLHCHGAEEESMEALLGKPMEEFHEALADEARKNPRFHYHYVTAREMVNLVSAAENGWKGSVKSALDYEWLPGPALATSTTPFRETSAIPPQN